jgi:thioredoxin-like negative regulator of GroEL
VQEPDEGTTSGERPRLIFFYGKSSGRSRRVESYLAQVLQGRGNHESFRLYRVEVDEHPELVRQFRIDEVPTLVVVDGNRERGRLETPKSCRQIKDLLEPWLN